MAIDHHSTNHAQLAATKGKADLAEMTVVGSGISETKRVSAVYHGPRGHEGTPPAWIENRDMVVELFTPIFQRSLQCPGRDQAQCCQEADGQACSPNWREREDLEWYAQNINMLLTQVNSRIEETAGCSAALAADEAFELGCLFTEALNKIRWDNDAKRGAKTLDSARSGGKARKSANAHRRSVAVTFAAVEALLLSGMGLTAAYRKVAKQQRVTDQTIAKEYGVAKKQR